MFPYVYALAGWTAQNDYTMMRPLVMDFPTDRIARELPDEYMFGPALLVAPVTEYKQRTRPVYLPTAATWYDYWTGKPAVTGHIQAAAPVDQMPVFVRAGSIVPAICARDAIHRRKALRPHYSLCLRWRRRQIHPYEDQGTTFDYENGGFLEIPVRWDDKTGTLTFGKRTGRFDGMLDHRTFQMVLVSKVHPTGFCRPATPSKTVQYAGTESDLSALTI